MNRRLSSAFSDSGSVFVADCEEADIPQLPIKECKDEVRGQEGDSNANTTKCIHGETSFDEDLDAYALMTPVKDHVAVRVPLWTESTAGTSFDEEFDEHALMNPVKNMLVRNT